VAARADERESSREVLAARSGAIDRVAAVVPCEPGRVGAVSQALHERAGRAKASAAVDKLYQIAKAHKKITLLYASRMQERNNATVLKEHLEGAPKPPSSVGRTAVGVMRIRKRKDSSQFSVLSTQFSVLSFSVLSSQFSVLSSQFSVLSSQFDDS